MERTFYNIRLQDMKPTSDLIEDIIEELNIMVRVPERTDLSMRQQEVELSMHREFIKKQLSNIADNEIYLLERLKHAETERFSKR